MEGCHDVINSDEKTSALIDADLACFNVSHLNAYLTDSPVRMHLIIRNHFSIVNGINQSLIHKVFRLFLLAHLI